MSRPAAADGSVRLVALLEGAKGLLVLAAGTGLLGLLHRDLPALAAGLIAHAHLNPASHYPQIFLDAVARLDDTRLRWLALGALAYAALRLVQAWGLLRGRVWAEWLSVATAAFYLPFELLAVWRHHGGHALLMLVLNLVVVAVLLRALWRRRRAAG